LIAGGLPQKIGRIPPQPAPFAPAMRYFAAFAGFRRRICDMQRGACWPAGICLI
jgi:hypothetical protein